jgi:hypothetical protein
MARLGAPNARATDGPIWTAATRVGNCPDCRKGTRPAALLGRGTSAGAFGHAEQDPVELALTLGAADADDLVALAQLGV